MAVAGAVLVLNSGSSSLKFGVCTPAAQDEALLLEGSAEGIGRGSGSLEIKSANGEVLVNKKQVSESQPEALKALAVALREHLHHAPVAVGHRIVHGGPSLREHQRITPQVLRQLEAAVHFAPLHIPAAVALIKQAQQIWSCPHFACFDNAFHHTMPEVAKRLPLPRKYFDQGVVRYGFHGLSCESIIRQLGADVPRRMIIAHLGSGSSVTALLQGESIDTSMGMTPTGGVIMSTRSGDLDPGVLIYLMRIEQLDADKLEQLLNHDCGLAGYSGSESDMKALEQRANSGDAGAKLAVEAFCISVRKQIGAYAALMGGADLLVFTGGIGEHSQAVRANVCRGLECFGLAGERIRVMPSQEDLQIARHTRALLSQC